MRALIYDNVLRYKSDHPLPVVPQGWGRIRVIQAGICGTDLEITRGYKNFQGILGHEFVGTVDQCADPRWLGRRVVGEINVACGQCRWCHQGLERHCPNRTALGILNHDGCMAEYCALPLLNLREVPPNITSDQAVFVEPLAAACRILEQQQLSANERIIVLGDGRLGILCAWVLTSARADVTLVGHHPEKLELARWRHLQTAHINDLPKQSADLVIESTGRSGGLATAFHLCRPLGTILLKSTVALGENVDLSPVVVNELNILGSRCGRFDDAIQMMQAYPDMPFHRLISARYPLAEGLAAFAHAARPTALKVLLEVAR
jgi:alcohol dehydrogenase